MGDDNEGWQRVATWLDAEIKGRGLSMGQVEKESGVSYKTIRKLLDGEPVSRRDRLGTLARALGFRADAFDAVRRGDEPTALARQVMNDLIVDASIEASEPGSGVERRLTAVETSLAEVRRAVQQLLDREAGPT